MSLFFYSPAYVTHINAYITKSSSYCVQSNYGMHVMKSLFIKKNDREGPCISCFAEGVVLNEYNDMDQ